MRTNRTSPVRYKPKMMKAKDLYAQVQANAAQRARDKKEEEKKYMDVEDDVMLNSVLDSVRPQYRDEAKRLQRRLQKILSEGKTSVANFEKEYNDNAPFPSEVRVNKNKVEVSAQVPQRKPGAARKSVNRWQPIKPSQISQLGVVDKPPGSQKLQNKQITSTKEATSGLATHTRSRREGTGKPTSNSSEATVLEARRKSKRAIIEISSGSDSSAVPVHKKQALSGRISAMKQLSLLPMGYEEDELSGSLTSGNMPSTRGNLLRLRNTRRPSNLSPYEATATLPSDPKSKPPSKARTAIRSKRGSGRKVPSPAARATKSKIRGRAGATSDKNAWPRLEGVPPPEYTSESENSGASAELEKENRSTYKPRHPPGDRLAKGRSSAKTNITNSSYSGTAKSTKSTKQPKARPDGEWVRTAEGKLFIPGLALSNCTDSPDSEYESAPSRGSVGPNTIRKKNMAITRRQGLTFDDSEDEDIRPRWRLNSGKRRAKSKLDILPNLFPANNPPTRFIQPMKIVTQEKESVQEPVETDRTHPENRHKRAINRTDLSFVTKPVEKNMTSRIKTTTAISKPVESVRAEAQFPDVQLGEGAYRGRVFMTIEREFGQSLAEGHTADEYFNFDMDIVPTEPMPQPERPKESREETLARYMEIAEWDPYASFF